MIPAKLTVGDTKRDIDIYPGLTTPYDVDCYVTALYGLNISYVLEAPSIGLFHRGVSKYTREVSK